MGHAVRVLREPAPELGIVRAGSVDDPNGRRSTPASGSTISRTRCRPRRWARPAGADAQHLVSRSDGRAELEDVTPRFGIAYDLFGTGKTALKFNIGKYLGCAQSDHVHTRRQPGRRAGPERDADLDRFEPQFRSRPERARGAQQSQFRFDGGGRLSYSPDALTNRSYNWELGVQLQQEIVPRVSINAAYYRRWYGNLLVTDDRPSSRPTTAPTTSRHPPIRAARRRRLHRHRPV